MYKIKMHVIVIMGGIFSTAHANRRSTTVDSLRFLLDGQCVYEDQTPRLLNLDENSKIDCALAQGVSVAPWLVDLNGNSLASCLALQLDWTSCADNKKSICSETERATADMNI